MTKGISKREKITVFLIAAFFGLASFSFVNASTTNGTIDNSTSYPYAWATNAGWINFATTYGNIAVTDSKLTGYAWSEKYGWINLSPVGSGGVANDNEGNLSGSAWAENLGWIDFSGVTINSSGKFTGTATGDNIGTINFDCSNCDVTTDWRPASTRSTNTNNNNTPSGGGAVYSPAPNSYSLSINNGQDRTTSTLVNLYLKGDNNTTYVWLSQEANLIPADRIEYTPTNGEMVYDFNLINQTGQQTVYAKFCNSQGACGSVIFDSIYYQPIDQSNNDITNNQDINSSVVSSSTEVVDKDIIDDQVTITDKVKNTIKKIVSKIDLLIPDFLKPWQKIKKEKLEDVRQYVSEITPLAFGGSWELLPKEPIQQYVFAPLPNEFKALAKNIPSIGKLFDSVGIKDMQDLRKLYNTKITVPSLSGAIGISPSKMSGGIALNDLSSEDKDRLPAGMVFAGASGQLVNFKTILSLSVNGRPVQELKTISGKKLSLSIKPEFSAKSVKGYLTFVSRDNIISYDKQTIWQKLGLVKTVLAQTSNGLSEVENKLVIEQFDYHDDDGDGIYTAEVYSPVPAGKYEVLTVIEYTDSNYGTKLVRLVTVVDPEGYVYEKIKDKELRISNALVSLYWLNPETKNYELWPADRYQQQNGQVTDTRGSYSFLVPPGTYYLQTSASGYKDYQSAIFKVTEGDGVHMNIELQSESWWTFAWDWRTWVIGLLVMLLLYMIEREFKIKKEKLETSNK